MSKYFVAALNIKGTKIWLGLLLSLLCLESTMHNVCAIFGIIEDFAGLKERKKALLIRGKTSSCARPQIKANLPELIIEGSIKFLLQV
jgi:hypothetical protein